MPPGTENESLENGSRNELDGKIPAGLLDDPENGVGETPNSLTVVSSTLPVPGLPRQEREGTDYGVDDRLGNNPGMAARQGRHDLPDQPAEGVPPGIAPPGIQVRLYVFSLASHGNIPNS